MHSLCQLCGKRPATTHLTELDPDGDRRELHLCGACIQAMGVQQQLEVSPPSIATLIEKGATGDEDEGETVAVDAPAAGEDEGCPICGLEFSEYASNNLFGCAHDYTAFGDRLETLLKRYHGATRHIGRAPQRQPEPLPVPSGARARASQRRKLETQLKDAVTRERYEEAAALRDQLRQLEAESAAKSGRHGASGRAPADPAAGSAAPRQPDEAGE